MHGRADDTELVARYARSAALPLQDRLALLVATGFADNDIAVLYSDLSVRTVRRWRESGVSESRAAARWEPVDDLLYITSQLVRTRLMSSAQIVAWFRSRQRALDWRRPLACLGAGAFEDVYEAMVEEIAWHALTAAAATSQTA